MTLAQNDTVDIKNSRDDRFWGMEDQRGEMDAMLRGGINGQPRYTEEDYVRELSRYIASPEVESPDMFSFHIPTLHAKESKWLSNMIILRPLKETIQLSYSIKSSSSCICHLEVKLKICRYYGSRRRQFRRFGCIEG